MINKYIQILLLSSISIASFNAQAGYYDNSLTTFTQYNMRSGMPNTDGPTDEWFENAFTDEIVFETNEVRYRSPVYKDFSIDMSTLLSAENDREKLSAALKWKGITVSFEEGEAKGKFINVYGTEGNFVNQGTRLPTRCTGSKWSCVEKIMINSNQEVKLEFSGNKIQYAFNWNEGLQSVVGYSTYEINSPILLSRKVDPEISGYSTSNSQQVSIYRNTETWGSMIDANGVTKSSSFYFGMDGSEYRLYQASTSGQILHHGFTGSFFVMANSYSIESSGEQEEYMNTQYGQDFSKAEDFSSDMILSFEFNLGYMGVLTLGAGGTQVFAQAGIRSIWFMSDSLADDPSYESEYVIDEFSGSDYNGLYFGVGGTF